MDTAYRVSPLRSIDPTTVADYQLVGRLGTGGMGVVYLAEDADGSYVAVKLIHSDLAADPEFAARFRSEVERARQVPPFCTAEFIGADLDHDPPYLVVEYVDGPSLDEVVTERGPLRGGALHSLAVGVATALTGIHGAGVIHRDLKPSNVLLPPGSPKVIDFGIARPVEATSHHTRTDVMVGTVAYMAPERLSTEPGTPVTPAADVFAWGCVITYAGTGRTPFLGDSPSATAGRILTQPPHLEGLPESLRDPVRLALSKDPAQRPTAPDLLAMLLGEKPVPRPTPARSRRRRLLPALVVGLLVAGGLTTAGLLVSRNVDPSSSALTPTGTSTPAPPAGSPGAVPPSPQPSPSAVPSRSGEAAARRSSPPPPSVAATAPTLPPGSGSANPTGRNLALGRPVTASSSEGPPWNAAEAVDGDLESRWSSSFSDPQWLVVDLGSRWRIREIVLRWELAYGVGYQVQVSTDGRTWQSVYATSNGQGGVVRITTDGVPGRYVRLYGTQRSSQYGYSLHEIEVR